MRPKNKGRGLQKKIRVLSKDPPCVRIEEHALVIAVRILDDQRKTSLLLLDEKLRWLRSSMSSLYDEMTEEGMFKHASAYNVASTATQLGEYLERMKQQNSAMARLHSLASDLDVEWPEEIAVTVVLSKKEG